MRTLIYVSLPVITSGVAAWIVIGPWFPTNQFELVLTVLFFLAPNVGGLWMIYTAARHERRPWRYIWLALLPYTFVWYYFERARPRQIRGKSS